MTQEAILIKYLAKEIVHGGLKSKIVEILRKKQLDNNKLIYLLYYHELETFAYIILKEEHAYCPPYLKTQYYRHLKRYLTLERELIKIIQAKTKNQITIIPIKGFSYSNIYYKRFGFRPLVDIDLLIKEEDLRDGEKLLESLGYKKELSKGKEKYWRHRQCHFEFIKNAESGPQILTELHWAIDFKRDKRYPLVSLWPRLRKISFASQTIYTLSPEDTIFSLALHQRRFGRPLNLKYVCDTGMILKHEKVDWNYLIDISFKENIRASLYFLLKQVEMVLDIDLEPALDKLRIPLWQKKAVGSTIKKYIYSPPRGERIYFLYLLCHFLLYDNIIYPFKYIWNIPYEQFAKFYNLPLYARKTYFIYIFRPFYIFYETLKSTIRSFIF